MIYDCGFFFVEFVPKSFQRWLEGRLIRLGMIDW